MATAMERATIGAEEARLQGKGPGGRAAEALANIRTGRDNPGLGNTGTGPYDNNHLGHTGTNPFNDGTTVENRGLFNHNRDHHNTGMLGAHGGMGTHDGMLGHTEEEMARLRTKTHITAEGDVYCPNPNLKDLPKEFETRVQVVQRYPEMKTVEKTDFVKEIHHEERTIIVPRTRIIHDDVERIDRVPTVRQVPRTRVEVVYRVVEEEREVVDMVSTVDYIDVPRIEQVPRVITEDIEERVIVPTVREVPVTRMVEVPTGNYCEAPAGSFVTPGDFNLLHHKGVAVGGGGGMLHRTKSSSSSSSSSSDGETVGTRDYTNADQNLDGTSVQPGGGRKKRSLLKRVLHQ